MKTINQSAKLHSERIWPISTVAEWDSNDMKTFCEQDFKAGVEFAQRWIPVEEGLPKELPGEISDLVLTKNKIGNVKMERYDFGFRHFTEIRYGGNVTHWRPIERL